MLLGYKKEPPPGFEPGTFGLQDQRSNPWAMEAIDTALLSVAHQIRARNSELHFSSYRKIGSVPHKHNTYFMLLETKAHLSSPSESALQQ